jgi:hypothetical protein
MSIEVNKTDRIVNVTVEKKYGKSIEADIDIANQRVGFKQEGEANFTYIDLPKLEFDDLTQGQKDSLKLTFDQLTQTEKDSLKLTFNDLTQAEKDSLKGEKGDIAIQGEYISYATLADAQSVSPKPSNGTLFQVEEEANRGVYTFQSGEAGGTRFEKGFVDYEEDYNIVYDPYLFNGIDDIDFERVTTEVIDISTPRGEAKGIKVTTAGNGSVRYRFTNNLLEGDTLTVKFIIHFDVDQTGWGILFYDGGFLNDYSANKIDLGDGWWEYGFDFTINSNVANSSYISVGWYASSMASNTNIIITGFEVIVPKTAYDELPLIKDVKKLKSDSEFFREKVSYINTPVPTKIAAIGDSLTAFSYVTPVGTKYYTTYLNDLLGEDYNIFNFGVGAEGSNQIAARQGGIQLSVNNTNGLTIPSTTDPVEITLNTSNLFLQGDGITPSVNPCVISGIMGNITYSNSIYNFTRLTSGTELFAPKSTPVFTNQQLNYNDSILIIGAGTNNPKNSSELRTQCVEDIKNMIKKSKNKDYIIMLPHTNDVDTIALSDLLIQEFGGNCVDIRNLFTYRGVDVAINEGWIQDAINNSNYSGSYAYKHITSYSDLNRITFTGNPNDYKTNAGVQEDISNKTVPRIFMADPTHFNLIGMRLQAYFINERLRLLNIVS